MSSFDDDLKRIERLGFSPEYCERLRQEHANGDDPISIEWYARAVVVIYDDRKEYVDAV